MSEFVVCSHFQIKIKQYSLHSTVIITDPNAEEEQLSTDLVTIAVADGELCLVHKPGGAALAPADLETCLRQALDREQKVLALLKSVLKDE